MSSLDLFEAAERLLHSGKYDSEASKDPLGSDFDSDSIDPSQGQPQDRGRESAVSAATPEGGESEFNYQVFWIINSIALVVILGVVIWCCRNKGADFVNNWTQSRANGQMSDMFYVSGVIARREQEEERKKETPAQRRAKLVASFERNKVKAAVKEGDFVGAPTQEDLEVGPVSPQYQYTPEDADENSFDSGRAPASLALPGTERTVPNCCAVCLSPYEVGDLVVWSSNADCQHAFHEECIVGWLIKMQNGTPCPCCRREFTDLAVDGEEDKPDPSPVRMPHRTFNVASISL